MTRIIGGTAGGRRLRTPKGEGTRPTSDRVREAMFSAIEAWCGSLQGLRFLDLYAGTGAVGLEAWSRGAAHVRLVEHDRAAAALIRDNARELGCRVADVVTATVATSLAATASSYHPFDPFDIAFSDPPYPLPDEDVHRDLAALRDHGWLAPGALVVVERGRERRGAVWTWPDGYDEGRTRRYGETVLHYAEARD